MGMCKRVSGMILYDFRSFFLGAKSFFYLCFFSSSLHYIFSSLVLSVSPSLLHFFHPPFSHYIGWQSSEYTAFSAHNKPFSNMDSVRSGFNFQATSIFWGRAKFELLLTSIPSLAGLRDAKYRKKGIFGNQGVVRKVTIGGLLGGCNPLLGRERR